MSAIHFSYFGMAQRTLILFPGWTHPAQKEPKFINELSKKFKIASLELPGYMHNQDLSNYQDFLFLARELHTELKKTEINFSAFVGFSLGSRLISTYLKFYPNDIKCIFISYPTEPYQLPIWARLLVNNRLFIDILRRNKQFKQFVVNKALRTINQDKTAVFHPDRVTLMGAFDSLIGLITSEVNLDTYKNLATFIYGEHDEYLFGAQKKNLNHLKIVKGAAHNCVRGHEMEIVNLIIQEVGK